MLPFLTGEPEPAEWVSVQQALAAGRGANPAAWDAFADCQAVEVYTDGSAPVRNPGGPAGFAALIVGFDAIPGTGSLARPAPVARVDLAGYIPARAAQPFTSNNRAEIAGVLAAWTALPHLGRGPWIGVPLTIWSDSNYAVYCGNGTWKRKKNTDLWPILDHAAAIARAGLLGGGAMEWVKGHAGNAFNAAADELATRAAFNFDAPAYVRYRAAQASAGQEMPDARTLARHSLVPSAVPSSDPTPAPSPPLPSSPDDWLRGADYTLVVCSYLDGGSRPDVGRAPSGGWYQLWTLDGRGRSATIQHPGDRIHEEAEYLTLIGALTDLLSRITAAKREPGAFQLTVYSRRELLVKQLTGLYRVKSATLQPLYTEAHALLDRFENVEVIWQPSHKIQALFPPRPKSALSAP